MLYSEVVEAELVLLVEVMEVVNVVMEEHLIAPDPRCLFEIDCCIELSKDDKSFSYRKQNTKIQPV